MSAPKAMPSRWDNQWDRRQTVSSYDCPNGARWGHEWAVVAWMALEQYRRDYAECRLAEEIGEDAYHLLMSTLPHGLIPPQAILDCIVTVEVTKT